MKKLLQKVRVGGPRDDGASAVEYGLLVALIAVVIAGTVVMLGSALSSKFKSACEDIGGSSATCAP